MTKLNILIHPDEQLRLHSTDVDVENIADKKLQQLIDDMIETMHESKGIGLAAPQVDVQKRLIIVKMDDGVKAFINPVITSRSLRKVIGEEGCLSVPGIHGMVQRNKRVAVEAYDRHGEKIEVRVDGLPAIILQHEIDHLDGILFIDKTNSNTSCPKM